MSWWIVRCPPLGHVQHTAHDMRREYTVMTALAATGVPVPETYALCSDPAVLERDLMKIVSMEPAWSRRGWWAAPGTAT
ncbi:phosphotransferase [Nonomuraea longispora]|uniref:phosphotransferase n=1 Tax=Nonomuraea longispora TaxID=1848320 RepID=UPI0026CC2893